MLRRAASAFVRSPATFSVRRTSDDHRLTKPPDWRDILSVGRMGRPRVERAGSNGTACSGARSGKGRTNRIARFIFHRKNIVINAEKHNPAVRRRSPRRRSSRSLSQAAPPFCQSERTVSRAPMHQIMWLRGFRAIPFPGADSIFSSRCGAISRRLRFAVRPSRAAIPTRETPRFKGSTRRPSPGRRCTEQIYATLTRNLSTWELPELMTSKFSASRPARRGRRRDEGIVIVERHANTVARIAFFPKKKWRLRT